MLRAEAAVFKPKELPTEADEGSCTFMEEACSTAEPSPALTAQCSSPMLSPYWGFEDSACSPDAMWTAALYGGYECGTYPPEFVLPDVQSEESSYMDLTGYKRPRANTEPAQLNDFTLEGVQDLQASLAGLFKQILPPESISEKQQDGESQGSTSAGGVSPPPGLAPPPGLEAPPGLDSEDVNTNVGGRTKTRDRTYTWPSDKDSRSSPLPLGTTTAMLRNIPNKYTQVGLVECLHEAGYRGQLDFIYLPIDFKNKCNVGYAFVNFRTAEACARFAAEFHLSNSRDKLPGFNSKKICEVSAARFQGCDENVRRLQASSVMPDLVANPEWLPKLFDEYGNELGFPVNETAKEAPSARGSAKGKFNMQRRKGSA